MYSKGSQQQLPMDRVYFSDTFNSFSMTSPAFPAVWVFGYFFFFLTSHDRFFFLKEGGGNRIIWFKKELLVWCVCVCNDLSQKQRQLKKKRIFCSTDVCYRERYNAPLNAINQIKWPAGNIRRIDETFFVFFSLHSPITCWIIHWHRPNRLFWRVLDPRERISWCT